jgi:tetratricopeptide (TPR) repeat protein
VKAATFIGLALVGCAVGRPTSEQRGDDAWHDARWADAVSAYRAAGSTPRVLAKLADASLQGGLLSESAEAWTRLGTESPDRSAEAAAGLARVAQAAENAGNSTALARALLGLRTLAPQWPLARLAAQLSDVNGLAAGDVAGVMPAILASSPSRDEVERWLVTLGRADQGRGSCEIAVPILEGALRTTTNTGLRDSATTTLAWCELGLGLTALAAAHPGEAERWLDRAAHREPDAPVARRALVGFGDARAAQGDTAAAKAAWEAVAAITPPDSLTQLALQRLQQAGPRSPGDTVTVRPESP